MKLASSQSHIFAKNADWSNACCIPPPPPTFGHFIGQRPWNPSWGEFANCSHLSSFGLYAPKHKNPPPSSRNVYTSLQPVSKRHACVHCPPSMASQPPQCAATAFSIRLGQ